MDPSPSDPADGLSISKRQQKKLLKRARNEQRYEQRRAEAEQARRLKKEELEKAAAKPPTEEQLQKNAERRRRREEAKSEFLNQVAFNVLLDCSFDELMDTSEIASMAHQIGQIYAVSRKMQQPFHLHVTDFAEGQSKVRRELLHQKPQSIGCWTATFHDDSLEQVLSRIRTSAETSTSGDAGAGVGEGRLGSDRVIYLSADSDTYLTEVERGATYIIGGLVDRNRHKNICADRARTMGLRTARLPLQQYVRLKSSAVLTTNHVAHLLSIAFETGGDWGKAVREVIPGRKVKEFLDGKGGAATGRGESDSDR